MARLDLRFFSLLALFALHCGSAPEEASGERPADPPVRAAVPAGPAAAPPSMLPSTDQPVGGCPRGSWCSHSEIVTPSDFRGAFRAPDTEDTWAITDPGTIYRYDGTKWSVSYAPEPTAQTIGTSLAGTSSTDVWAAYVDVEWLSAHPGPMSPEPRSHVSHWDGHVWTADPTEFHGRVLSVLAVSPTDVYAAGDSIWHLSNGVWTSDTSLPPGKPWVDLAGTDASDIYAAATDGTLAHFDGTSWSVVTDSALPQSGVYARHLGLWSGGKGELDVVWRDSHGNLHWTFRDEKGFREIYTDPIGLNGQHQRCVPVPEVVYENGEVGRRIDGKSSSDHRTATLRIADSADCARELYRSKPFDRPDVGPAGQAYYLPPTTAGVTAFAGPVWVGLGGRIWTANGTARGSNALADQVLLQVAAVSPKEIFTVSRPASDRWGPRTLRHYTDGKVEVFDTGPVLASNLSVDRGKLLYAKGTLYGLGSAFSKWNGAAFHSLPIDCAGCEESIVVAGGVAGAEEPWALGRGGASTFVYRWNGAAWERMAEVPGVYFNVRGSGASDLYLWGTKPYEHDESEVDTHFGPLFHWDGAHLASYVPHDNDALALAGFDVLWVTPAGKGGKDGAADAWAIDFYHTKLSRFDGVQKGVDVPLPAQMNQLLAPTWLTTDRFYQRPLVHFDGAAFVPAHLVRDWSAGLTSGTTIDGTLFAVGRSGMLLEHHP